MRFYLFFLVSREKFGQEVDTLTEEWEQFAEEILHEIKEVWEITELSGQRRLSLSSLTMTLSGYFRTKQLLGNWAKGKYFRNVIWNTKLTLPLAQRGSWHVVRPGLAQITYRDPASIPVFDLIDDQDRAGKVEALKKEMEVNEKCEAMRDNDIAKQKVELT